MKTEEWINQNIVATTSKTQKRYWNVNDSFHSSRPYIIFPVNELLLVFQLK